MITRKYKPEDCATLAELFYNTVHTVNAADYSKDQLDVWATGKIDLDKWNISFLNHTTLIAEVDDQIVGFADMDNSGYLDRLYVHKDYQRKGIATELVNALEVAMKKENVISFETYASITSKPFFEKLGYGVKAENIVERNGVFLKNFRMIKSMIDENSPTIETDRLILRKFEESDVNDFFQIMSDKEVNTFLPWVPLKTMDEAMKYLEEHYFNNYAKPTSYRYAICLKEDNKAIGYIGLSDNESHDLGYGLKKEFWNKGIATEAAKALLERIKAAGYPYITATHDINNPSSGVVMKKLGMTYKYSYVEQWQPKDLTVTFRMYQLKLDDNDDRTYMEYWNKYDNHFVETDL